MDSQVIVCIISIVVLLSVVAFICFKKPNPIKVEDNIEDEEE
jgi:hypothetical protein